MQKVVLLVSFLAVAGCSKKKDEPKAGSSAAAGTSTKPAVTPAGAGGGGAKLTCDKILAKDVRDTFFPGAKIVDRPQGVEFAAACDINDGSADVTVNCHDNVMAAMDLTLKGLKENFKDGKDVPGIGKETFVIDLGPGGAMITTWDGDSNCQASIHLPAGMDAAAFTGELLASLPPK